MLTRRPSLRSRLLTVALPVFASSARPRALGGLALLLGLLLSVSSLNVVNSYVGRDMMTALTGRDAAGFYRFAGMLACVFAMSTVVEVSARYTEQRLNIGWRDWLTRRFLDRYLGGKAYLRLTGREDIDNPDQRASEDVRAFTQSSLSFLVLLTNASLTLLAFLSVLGSITPWLLVAVVAYAAAGSAGTVLLGKRLVGLDIQQLKKEADFRFALGRLRHRAAEVAEAGAEPMERERLTGRLAAVVENMRELIVVSRNLGFFTSAYNFLPQLIPVAIVAPMYARGDIEFGSVTQAMMAFSQALGALSLIVTQFQQLAAYSAVIHRLGAMWEATEPEVAGGPPAFHGKAAAPAVTATPPAR